MPTAEERKAEIEKQKRDDARVVHELEDLLLTPGWKFYTQLLEKHIKDKTTEALQPLTPMFFPGANGALMTSAPDGLAHCLVGEAAKGAIMGLRLALSLPSGIIAQSKVKPSAEE